MANNRPTLYVGMTSNLVKRVYEHKHGIVDGFTKKYGLHKLVYFELYNDPIQAIAREKQLKKFLRQEKLDLIRSVNTGFTDLYPSIM